ncbi:MAG TPA: acyl-CoA carboxylase subunit beta [Gemmatimonadetes bacterium]|nr:acyl-CoA carboxylase subunit beta [Gemmatimonadota bacterium]
MAELSLEIRELRERLYDGGGTGGIEHQHGQGKLTARERLRLLFDENKPTVELGLLIAHDLYDGQAPGAGVVTTVGCVSGRDVIVVANDATVRGGAWWPETITKILRAQEVAMRCRIPIIYLIDSVGVHLPYRSGVFPGQYGAARIFYYNSVMRRYLRIPQLAAVMGPCLAAGVYLPALSDVILMVEGTSFMGFGSPDLARSVTGQMVDTEELGGARAHVEVSAVAHYVVASDEECVKRLRKLVHELPLPKSSVDRTATPPQRLAYELYDLIPDDHRQPSDMQAILECILDGEPLQEFQADHAQEIICGTGFLAGYRIGVIANARGTFKSSDEGPIRFGGIVYTASARKVAYFIETMNRYDTPILFVQDVSGFMVGAEAEHSGVIRASAEFVEAMATAKVPKIVLTLNHASGAGYYAMGGQGFDPDFVLSLPTGRMGVMESESAVMAIFSAQLQAIRNQGLDPGPELTTEMDQMRAEYEEELDARFAAARGFVDAILLPEELRDALGVLLRASLNNPGPHLGPFQIQDESQ